MIDKLNCIENTCTANVVTEMFHSQSNQDQFLETNVFKGFQRGIFVDVGAHDGITLNNTLYFENHNHWSGFNIEPNQHVYDQLQVNRPNSINLNCAICSKDGTAEFLRNTGYTEMLSGLKDTFDTRHYQRLTSENEHHGSSTETVQVQTKRLETVFDEYKVNHIHYLSIDVEGAEFDVIKSINFDKVFIDVIEFENNYRDTSIPIIQYLESKNYSIIAESSDVFMIHENSQFST